MIQASLGLVVLDALGAFAVWYWVGIRGEWQDHITTPPWLRDYANEPHRRWVAIAPMGLMATLLLLLWLGI